MPFVEVSHVVDVPASIAFAIAHTQGEMRFRWDRTVTEQRLMNGALTPDVGVRCFTRSRLGGSKVSEYTSFRPPTQSGMALVKGPWYFREFGGGWIFTPTPSGRTEAIARYNFTTRPRLLRPFLNRMAMVALRRELRRRVSGFVDACRDADIVAAVQRPGGEQEFRVTFRTTQFDATVEFWSTQLGFPTIHHWEEPERGRILRILGTGCIQVLEADLAPSPAFALAAEVTDVDRRHRDLVRQGLKPAGPPEDQPWGHRSFTVTDPNGISITFFSLLGAQIPKPQPVLLQLPSQLSKS